MVNAPTSTVNEIQLGLGQQDEGTISSVSVYADRAEICRSYRFNGTAGQNRVVIYGLPYTLDESSVRVEGRGEATIHDVTISRTTVTTTPPTTSPELDAIEDQREELAIVLSRYRKMQTRLDRYLEARTEHYGGTEHAIPDDVLPVMESYSSASEKYDAKVLDLKRALRVLDKARAVAEEQASMENPTDIDPSRPLQATISLHAESEMEVELDLKYVVIGAASWKPLYEIRANTGTQDSPIEISYKAAIQQDTGEDWTDVPIILETAKPTFALTLPTLGTLNVGVYAPPPPPSRPSAPPPPPLSRRATGMAPGNDDDERLSARQRPGAPPVPAKRSAAMQFAAASVTSRGNVNATFKVPGLISIPSDGAAHNVTIAKLKPDAKLSWLAVPQINTRVHLTARITNISEFTLLAGPSSVYVDGSYVAKSTMPMVSPQETFTCTLGLDPSIRIAFPPQTKKSSTYGILTKTSSTSFAQRISVDNTKSTAIADLKVLARIPVSQDARIAVKLVSPLLPPPPSASEDNIASSKESSQKTPSIQGADLIEGVTAQWHSGDTAEYDDSEGVSKRLGSKEGKILWRCTLEAKTKVDLTLEWEVSAPKDVVVTVL